MEGAWVPKSPSTGETEELSQRALGQEHRTGMLHNPGLTFIVLNHEHFGLACVTAVVGFTLSCASQLQGRKKFFQSTFSNLHCDFPLL